MKLSDAVVVGLAVARLTTLVTTDEITEPLRRKVDDWARGYPVGSVRERLAYLVSCSKCTSVWAAGAVLGLWVSGEGGKAVVRLLAASQGALSLLTLYDAVEFQSA